MKFAIRRLIVSAALATALLLNYALASDGPPRQADREVSRIGGYCENRFWQEMCFRLDYSFHSLQTRR